MPAYQVSGITSITTGLQPVTGLPSGYSGPWLIETQSLTVEYVRVPIYGMVTGSAVVSLSATNSRTTNINGTGLHVLTHASYSRVKSYESFATSAYLQSQKFSILPDADAYGEYYGPASALSAVGILGPAGTVITSKPYIRRVLWDDALHSETTVNTRGTNVIFGKVDQVNTLYDCANMSEADPFRSFQYLLGAGVANSFVGGGDWLKLTTNAGYFIQGPYAVSKENSSLFISFLNSIGEQIRNSRMYKIDPAAGVDVTGISNGVTLNSSVFTGTSEYTSNRHDYT